MNRLSTAFSLVLALTLVGAGCSKPATPSEPATTPVVGRGADGCDHPYAPFDAGLTVRYLTTYGATESGFTYRVLSNEGGKLKIEYAFGTSTTPLTVGASFVCDGGTIKADGYLDMGNSLAGQRIKMATESVEGEFMPKDLAVGTEWTTSYVVAISSDDPAMKDLVKDLRQKITVKNKVVADEIVTVRAGTFQALKIESETELNFVSVAANAPSGVLIPATSWFVKDVGMVKSTAGGESGGTKWEVEATEVGR
jgi:hypothetical protein